MAIAATNTQARLDALRECGVLKPRQHREISEAYGFLAETCGSSPVLRSHLSREGSLRRAAEQAQLLGKRISFDFLGSAL